MGLDDLTESTGQLLVFTSLPEDTVPEWLRGHLWVARWKEMDAILDRLESLHKKELLRCMNDYLNPCSIC